MTPGTLFLIPVPLSPDGAETIPVSVQKTIEPMRIFIVENDRTARRMLRRMGFTADFSEVTLITIDKHSKIDPKPAINSLMSGHDVGLLSESGCPAVADPGSPFIREAHRNSIPVVPLTGPSSVLLALMASGFNGQSFVFHGYLPIKPNARLNSIRKLESDSSANNITQIFIETPYRNNEIVKAVINNCRPETYFCVASDLTSPNESIISQPVSAWKRMQLPDFHKIPAVFLIYAG
ncbi:MAG: SAM-dependent methyltransferase [Bacteroidetes bacterium]|nr:SAM-dependent methyltransferase [Bacteroidota bacterium]MBU1719938.1 SAM-dependent methyltransferase [Bacteroidota bacterium]